MERTLKDWIVASRPWSFTASLIPVISITAYLYWQMDLQQWHDCDWICAALALPMLVLMQAAGNLIGDYYDHIMGVDRPGSLNQVRHIQSGKFTPKEILHYGYACLLVACLIGLCILARCGWEAIWFGIVGAIMTGCYPWFKRHALGDVDVLFGYALLPALGVGYAVTHLYLWQLMLLSLPAGSITVAILHANNTRDILNDRQAGLTTMCGMIGGRASQWIYLVELVLPYILVIWFVFSGLTTWTALFVFLTLPLAIRHIRTMMKAEPLAEEPIGSLDQQTAQLQMMFGILYTIAFIINHFVS